MKKKAHLLPQALGIGINIETYPQNRRGFRSAPEPSTDRTPGHLPQDPGQPAGEREPEAPTVDELKRKKKNETRFTW